MELLITCKKMFNQLPFQELPFPVIRKEKTKLLNYDLLESTFNRAAFFSFHFLL